MATTLVRSTKRVPLTRWQRERHEVEEALRQQLRDYAAEKGLAVQGEIRVRKADTREQRTKARSVLLQAEATVSGW